MQQAAQRAYHEHVAQHGSPFRHMAKVPAIMVANAAVFLSVFNGVRSLMNSKVRGSGPKQWLRSEAWGAVAAVGGDAGTRRGRA